MKKWQICTEPESTDELLTNPGIGFIAAPPLMGNPDEIRDSRGKPVEKYRFTPDSRTCNHPDSGVYYSGASWNVLEPREGRYRWDTLDRKLEAAQKLGCTSVVRCSPYSLDEDIPAWLRERYPDDPEFPFWRIDPNTTEYAACWARFIRAFGERYDGHPVISSVDMALVGAWGEGGGSEFADPARLDEIIRAYLDGFRITPLQMLLHDPVSVGCIRRYGRDVGYRVDCLGDMGGFHGKEWSHMLDFYPQNIENFGMHDAWKRAPVVFEACWHMTDWYLSGWDIDYIVDESLKWHISSYNGKQTAVPLEWRDSTARWLRKMGYRFELRRCRASIEAGVLTTELLWTNSGVAPCYQPYPILLRLKGDGADHRFSIPGDIRDWLPGGDYLTEARFFLSDRIAPGRSELSVGIETQVPEIGTLRLAIPGRDTEGYYPMGTLTIKQKGRTLCEHIMT